jgi:hypothetical protein
LGRSHTCADKVSAIGGCPERVLMNSTRYRDLLTSATQITALHNSSIRLSRQLRDIADISSNPDTVAITTETSSVTSDTDDVLARLPAAAHMKLLLDAAEALYVYLGNHEYLRAAYLWLVARVTKEGLSRMTDEAGSVSPLRVCRCADEREGRRGGADAVDVSASAAKAVGDTIAVPESNSTTGDRVAACQRRVRYQGGPLYVHTDRLQRRLLCSI